VLNSKNFGVPQNRERVFIVGHLRGTSRPKVFPIEQGSTNNLKYSGGVISSRQQWLDDGNTFSRNFSQGQRIYSTDGISQTLAGNAGGQGGKTGLYETEEMKIRRLTPTECERLQGFPDGWTEGVSDTQRYKTLGNAVTVNVIREIMTPLLELKR
jgi:site-specific DNA-cytosine methylase